MQSEDGRASRYNQQSRVLIQNLVFLMFWAGLFTLSYAQSPLYTSNQNQYFLHGLARAGLGDLQEDWLVNTLDPTPVFSKFVEISWQILPWQPVFYLYFGLLAGLYLYSVFGIVSQLWDISASRAKSWLFLSVLVILHSAALRYLISSSLGVNWDYLLDGGVAGQRLIGPVLQPSTFGVFLVLSIYLFLRRKTVWAVICLLLASFFHPTYLLSAAVLTAVYLGLHFWENRDLRATLSLGAGALLGVSPILWHTYSTFGATTPELAARAREILVESRIPHHGVISAWFDVTVLVKLGFVGFALLLLHHHKKQGTVTPDAAVSSTVKLFHILLWPSLIAISLTIIRAAADSNLLALLFPWRLSTWLVPLSVSIIAGWAVNGVFVRFHWARFSRGVIAASLILALIFAAAGAVKFWLSWQEKHSEADRPVLAYIEAHKQPGEVYLIPLKMQDFRLATGAPVYVEFKSIPYKDAEVLEWRRRVLLAEKFFTKGSCRDLPQLAAEGITHLVLPSDLSAMECFGTELEFLDENFWLIALSQQ